jgi:hypothetical protein
MGGEVLLMPLSFHPFGCLQVLFGVLYLQFFLTIATGLLYFSRPLLQRLIRERNPFGHFLQIQLQ